MCVALEHVKYLKEIKLFFDSDLFSHSQFDELQTVIFTLIYCADERNAFDNTLYVIKEQSRLSLIARHGVKIRVRLQVIKVVKSVSSRCMNMLESRR